ncbi:pilus assembly FimT family protein [Marinomonas transparens]|uniref:Type II secretion system protein n=1 Tax=Marinomonas transparens TaxID=2795388 RepID=A0A934JSF8_9GAMM|nr:type II secretion system protein [Marinomonas transparens]MBJ7539058.1 type II secretion system protein [Marinomonas transparens]
MMVKSGSEQRGFTLLELLVVLFILVSIVGLVSPYIAVGTDDDVLEAESQALRFVLQDVVDQSWIKGSTFVVVREPNSALSLWQEKQGEWEKLRTLYTLPKVLSFQLVTNGSEMEEALEVLDFNKNGVLVFLSSGEYLPFTLTLFSEASSEDALSDSSVTLNGDGINEIFIE